MLYMGDLRLILHFSWREPPKSRAQRLLRVDQGATIARLSNVVCKSRRRASRNLDGCRIGRYYEPFRLPDQELPHSCKEFVTELHFFFSSASQFSTSVIA